MFTLDKKEYDETKLDNKGKIAFNNIQVLAKKSFLFETLFGLLFEYDKEFYKIVMNHYAKEVEKPRSSDKKGT